MMDKIEKRIVSINNQPVKVGDDEGVIYNLAPLKTVVSLEFRDLKAGVMAEVDLSQYIDATYQVVDVTSVLPIDLDDTVESLAHRTEDRTAHCIIRTYEEGELVNAADYRLRRGFNVDESQIISPEQVWRIYPEFDFVSLTFHCERIINERVSIAV